MNQQEWEQQVDRLFDVLDPKNGHTQAESDKAVENFFDVIVDDAKKQSEEDIEKKA